MKKRKTAITLRHLRLAEWCYSFIAALWSLVVQITGAGLGLHGVGLRRFYCTSCLVILVLVNCGYFSLLSGPNENYCTRHDHLALQQAYTHARLNSSTRKEIRILRAGRGIWPRLWPVALTNSEHVTFGRRRPCSSFICYNDLSLTVFNNVNTFVIIVENSFAQNLFNCGISLNESFTTNLCH